jgi:hypothetical protein
MTVQIDFNDVIYTIKDLSSSSNPDDNKRFTYIDDPDNQITKLNLRDVLEAFLGTGYSLIYQSNFILLYEFNGQFILIHYEDTCGRYDEIREFVCLRFNDINMAVKYLNNNDYTMYE